MAFSDADIHSHLRSIGLMKASITQYDAIGIPSAEDRTVGVMPHMAELKQKNMKVFTLAEQGERSNGSLKRPIHWTTADKAED